MPEWSPLLSALLILLALWMGFVADRTHLCTVSAVAEIITERRARVLWNLTRIVLWILGVVLLLDFALEFSPLRRDRYAMGGISLVGGLVFGFGAALNGGCSLQLITRLARGNLGTVLSLVGLPLGMALARVALVRAPELRPVREVAPVEFGGLLQLGVLVPLVLWMLWELFRLLRGFRLSEARARVLAPAYQPASSAALMGIAHGTLFSLVGTWMLTYTVAQSLTNLAYPDTALYRPVPALLWYLLGAYLVGISLSALQTRHARLEARPRPLWLRYFLGGVLMGMGSALVPGGNDVLLLNSIPGLSVHALPAYLAMLVGIGIALAIMMRFFPEQEIC